MAEFFTKYFFVIDLILGLGGFLAVMLLFAFKRIGGYVMVLFWTGVILGFTWEFGCNLQMILSDYPVARFLKLLPVHFMVLVAVHSLWDGCLFLAGAWLVKKISGESFFGRFRLSELSVLIVWGQLQEFLVEMASSFSGGWEWISYSWNPVLFIFNNHTITLFPQLIWFFAMIVFYCIAVILKKRLKT